MFGQHTQATEINQTINQSAVHTCHILNSIHTSLVMHSFYLTSHTVGYYRVITKLECVPNSHCSLVLVTPQTHSSPQRLSETVALSSQRKGKIAAEKRWKVAAVR